MMLCQALDSDDDFHSGCRNVSHHYRQQSFSGLHSPGRSNYTITCFDLWWVNPYERAGPSTFMEMIRMVRAGMSSISYRLTRDRYI